MESGAYAEADRWHSRITPYMHFHQGEEFEGSSQFFAASLIKSCMEYVGLYGGPVRPPFRALTPRQKDQLFRVLDDMGVKALAGSAS